MCVHELYHVGLYTNLWFLVTYLSLDNTVNIVFIVIQEPQSKLDSYSICVTRCRAVYWFSSIVAGKK